MLKKAGMFQTAYQVIRFEIARTLTPGRLAIWVALGTFPSLLIGLLRLEGGGAVEAVPMRFISYALVPQISCMLGLLLWATPAVSTELESQTWIYLTLRPHGRAGVALGKYVVAVLWTASYGVLSAVSVSLIGGLEDLLRQAATLIALVMLSSLCYAALFLFIGVTVYRRATVVAVVYSLVLEGLVSWIPATIHEITVSYRLRSLFAMWVDIGEMLDEPNARILFSEQSAWLNVAALLCYALILLSLSIAIIRRREYPVQTEA